MQIHEDTTLIKLIQSGKAMDNDRAFKQLYQTHKDPIFNMVVNNSGDPEDAEDIFQDGLIVLYHQIKKGSHELNCSLKTYLYSICRNLWLKKLRTSSRVVKLSDTLKHYIPIEESSLRTLEENEQKKVISEFLDQLGEGCKTILTKFYFEKIKMTEIAQRMGLANEQVAKNKKSGCMKKLKVLMKNSSFFK